MHAVFGEDYTHANPLQVQFGPCDPCTGGDLQQTVTITIIDDDDLEFDHSFRVGIDETMVQPAGLNVVGGSTVVLIRDDGMTVTTYTIICTQF